MAVRTNRITNPSFETNNTLWTVNGGATLTRVTSTFAVGAASGQVVCTAVANSGVQSNAYTVGVGVAVAGSLMAKGNAGGETIVLELRNQAGTVINSLAITLTTTWTRYSVTGTTPGSTTSVHIRTNKVAATAHTYFIDAAIIEQRAGFLDYFDGATADDLTYDYAWTGTAHLSTATETEKAPIVAVGFTNADPSPRIEVTLTPLDGAVVTMSVWRTWAGKTALVRGASREPAAGGFFVSDFEAPLNTPVTYAATGYAANGSVVAQSETSNSVTLVEVVKQYAWISDPLSPTLALKVTLEQSNAASSAYVSDTTVLAPIGVEEPIALTGTRRAASQVPVSLLTFTVGDRDLLLAIFKQANPVCIRPATSSRLPPLAFLTAPEVVPTPVGWDGTITWTFTGTVVAAQAASVVVPFHTWEEVIDAYATWSALIAAKATWLDVIKDPV